MFKRSNLIFALLAIFVLTLACANPLGGNTSAQPDNVETIVAATFQALTATAPQDVAPQDSIPGLLPHSLYFLNNDGAGLTQVYRLEKDGKTVTQLTFEPVKVDYYDVSPVDGSVAFVSNNQLLTVNADGSNRSMIVDGGPKDENNPFISNLSNPVWSPNGQTIAFGYKGLNFYSIASGQSNLVLENQITDNGNGFLFPTELYWPEKYSADGSKLLITLGYYEGAFAAIYYPNGGALVRMQGGEGALICCGDAEWAANGSAFYAANPSIGMFNPGLWRVDAANGNVTTLLQGEPGNGTINFADAPHPSVDGQLYYFFLNRSNTGDFANRAPLQLVRSAPDGVTNRTVLRPETYELMNEALWAPDGSFVIAVVAPIPEVYVGGEARLVYTDGQKGVVSLVPFAIDLKWGP